MEIRTQEVLLGGVAPQFVVDVTPDETVYWSDRGRASLGELVAAFRAAATYRSPMTGTVVATIVGVLLSALVSPWLALIVAAGGIVAIIAVARNDARRRRIAIVHRLDERSSRAFESLSNGVGWLATSRALWQMTDFTRRFEGRAGQGDVPGMLTNVRVPWLAAATQTLYFLPDALVVRDHASNFVDVSYASLRVAYETTQVSESGFVPPDSRQVGHSWLYANKNGSPDRRRRDNRQIPLLEYGRVTLTWRGSGCVLIVSNVDAARRFADAMYSIVRLRNPAAEKPMTTPTLRPPTQPTELERALQASIDRKARLDELAREERTRVAPAATAGDVRWIRPGASATIHGFATGDLVYVGRHIPSLDGDSIEPAALDPTLPVDSIAANTSGDGISYWPSYSSISAASRAAFLQWLAGGRKDPHVYIGYVFIFFYGLERRVYEFLGKRGATADEVLAIAREVARLLEIHASRSNSFASYGSALLDLIARIEPRARELVPSLAIRLGELARDDKPIPAAVAYEWVRTTQYLNTAATRCAREFELLFHVRYAKQFGDGIAIPPSKISFELQYRPASAALEPMTLTQRDVPNVMHAERPLAKLTELARECSSALDPFSRFLGKNPAGRESLAAFALLPEELVEGTHSADAKALAALVVSRLDGDGRAHLGAGELLQYVRIAKPDKVSKSEATLLAQSLEKLGYGIEPDVRLGGPVVDVDGRVIVFRRLPDCPSVASDDYAAATLLIRLGAMVSTADDALSDAERVLLERHVEERLQLTPGERQRLAAHLAWILEADLGMTGVRRKLEALPQDARRAVGKLLIEVAATDGQVDPSEMKMLEKIYALLELPSADLYRDVHAAHADEEPVIVDASAASSKSFAIPQPPPTTATGIDMSRVRLKIAETREVSALLGSIFVEDTVAPAAAAPVAEAGTIGTLDAAHSELLRRLAARESWPREDVEHIAAELSLLPDGALETINDFAYATADAPFWEDDDPLAINSDVARELIQ